MSVVNLVVVDFLGRDQSRFIGDLNEYFAIMPETKGLKHTRRVRLQSLLDQWESRATIEIDEKLQLTFLLAQLPVNATGEPQTELWEILEESALGYIFVVSNDENILDEATQFMKRLPRDKTVPLMVLVQEHPYKQLQVPQIRKGLSIEEEVLIFEYGNVTRSEIRGFVKSLLAQIAE